MIGLTAREILGYCPPRVKEGAASADIHGIKPSVSKDGRAILKCLVSTTHFLGDGPKRNRETKKHIVVVESLEPKKSLGLSKVKVSCGCEDFCFTWEVALHKKGAADIRHSNGDKPVEKNPAMRAGCCKHVYKILRGIISSRV
jgi:hypothetical protein